MPTSAGSPRTKAKSPWPGWRRPSCSDGRPPDSTPSPFPGKIRSIPHRRTSSTPRCTAPRPTMAGKIELSRQPLACREFTRKKAVLVPDQSNSHSVTYADAGVDIPTGDRAKERIKFLAQKTLNRNVLAGVGGFGALFRLDLQRFKSPILVSSADGVGTKLKVAFEMGLHHTVGQDLVNHCVNDIAVQGATALFFLDYLATGKLDNSVIETVVQGLSEA